MTSDWLGRTPWTASATATTVGALMLLMLAFGASAGTAKTAKNSVGAKQLKRAAVKAPKIAKGAVKAAKIANGAVKRAKIADSSVNGAKVVPDSLGGTEIDEATLDFTILQRRLQGACPPGEAISAVDQAGALTCEAIGGGATGPAGGDLTGEYPDPSIAAGVVGTTALTNLAVTAAKLANNSVNSAKVQSNSLTGANIDESTLDGLWFTGGNAGTNPGTDFLGTTDYTALELRVDGTRALRLEPAVTEDGDPAPNVIGGMAGNTAADGVHSATIAGGGWLNATTPPNRVTAYGATVGGGLSNLAGTLDDNPSTAAGATVAGGYLNEAMENTATVGGGGNNNALGFASTVGGGFINTASGLDSTVPGGRLNTAAGTRSFAAGFRAKANHQGSFVWGDSSNTDISTTANNQFIARASGGFFLQGDSSLDNQNGFLNTSTGAFLSTGGAWTNSSDVNEKQDFEEVDPADVLAELAALPIGRWSYKAEPGVRHIGPTAQDFRAAFGLGTDERHIASVDADGVALAAIKGLHAENRELRSDNEDLSARIGALEEELAALRGLIEE